MNGILIQQTDSNPFIELAPGEEKLMIKGNSFIPDPRGFYTTVLDWAKNFKTAPDKKIAITVIPGYYSTSNIQVFNLVFKTLAANNPGNVDITFSLEREDEEDMKETMYSLTYNTGLEPAVSYQKSI